MVKIVFLLETDTDTHDGGTHHVRTTRIYKNYIKRNDKMPFNFLHRAQKNLARLKKNPQKLPRREL